MADPGLTPLPEADWERATPEAVPSREELAAYLRREDPSLVLAHAQRLGGGLANTTLRLDPVAGEPRVLRLYQRDPSACRRELALFARLPAEVPLPAVRHAEPDHDPPFCLFERVEGQRLELAFGAAPAAGPALGRAVGEVLAAIHRVELPALGFLDAALEVPEPWPSLREPVEAYFAQLLGGRAAARLGSELSRDVAAWVRAQLPRVDALDPTPRLAHADFKPTNLLVLEEGGWRVSAVLDWEFALAYTPLGDLGQLLRHPTPAGFEAGVAAGYRRAGGHLPEGWRTTARLLDLLNLLGFLDGEAERPNVARTCRARIEETLRSD